MMLDQYKNLLILPIQIVRLSHALDLPLPAYQTPGAVGADLMAAIPENEKLLMWPGQQRAIPTGIKIVLPDGYEAQVRSRSGLTAQRRLIVANSPGTIDWDFRGEIFVILKNDSEESQPINRGDRIAQMVIAPVARAEWLESFEPSETERGAGGFGSTGV